jgi:phosphoglucosamine mutase
MKLVVDAAHGAAYHMAPNVFHELGAEVTASACSPDGLNINDKVRRHASAGAGGRGDGQPAPTTASRSTATPTACRWSTRRPPVQRRRTAVPDGGRAHRAGREARARRGGHADDQHGGRDGAESSDVEFVRAKVGDRYVLEELDKRGWLLGGEGSGHLLALDRHTTGDGLVSALQVLQACVRSGKTVAQLLDGVTLFPQTLINVRMQPGQDWKETRRWPAKPNASRPSSAIPAACSSARAAPSRWCA